MSRYGFYSIGSLLSLCLYVCRSMGLLALGPIICIPGSGGGVNPKPRNLAGSLGKSDSAPEAKAGYGLGW